MTRCAVLGDPIAHSLSPVLHRTAYEVLGLDWSYDAVRVPSGGLADFLSGLDESWRGLSLTMPLKREVMALPAVASVTERALLAGGANTVTLGAGALHLDNTDLPGAAAAVREVWDRPVRSVVILGAGATAASVGLAMCDLGATSVHLLARSALRAAETEAAIAAHAGGPLVTVSGLDDDAGHAFSCDVVVSTVPVAAQTPDLVRRCSTVPVTFEALYDPWPTPLASAALSDGRVLVGGLDLLVHQAVLQVEIFTGVLGTLGLLGEMRAAGAEALEARAG